MFARRSAHNDLQSFLETPDMMPNFACVEKFFTHMTFKTSGGLIYSGQKQFSTREILNAKAPEPGGASRWKPRAYRGTTLTRRPATYYENRIRAHMIDSPHSMADFSDAK